MDTEIATCHNCGFPVTSGARFCQNCGVDVSQEQGMMPTMSVGATPSRKTVAEATLELLRRETLGEYEILGELGRGGMATVYLAHHISLDRKVAIKVMTPSLMDEGLAERFRREARTAAALNHPHIIPIYGVYERSTLIYFVMKFVAGQSLDPILKQHGPLPVKMARTVLAQAASALGYAHRRGVVHRDVKPANIMIDDEGWVVMTDFGIAKAPSATGLTLTGVTVGTPAYMSPEQCLGKEVTGASDQYSLGVVAYELLTGKKPFIATTAMAMMYAHFNEDPKPIRELRPDIPEELEATVHRMLAKDPEHRWPRIDDAFGTPVLAHDDPVREQLISYAQASPNATMAAQISTPTSPVPPARRTSTRLPSTPSTTEPVVPAASRRDTPVTPTPPPAAPLTDSAPSQPAAGASPVKPPAPRPSVSTAETVALSAVSSPVVEPVAPPPVHPPAHAHPAPRPTSASFPPSKPARRTPVAVWGLLAVVAVVGGGLLVRSAMSPRSAATPSQPAVGDTVASIPGQGGEKGGAALGRPDTSRARSSDSGAAVKPESQPKASPAAALARIDIPQGSQSLEVGKSVGLDARLLAADGVPLPDRRTVAWSSSATGIAAVDGGGTVRGVAPGKATITAAAEGRKASVTITVRPAAAPQPVAVPIAAIRVQPESTSVGLGQDVSLVAAARDARGNQLGDRQFVWTSSDDEVASVSAAGRVTGRSAGLARITVRGEGVSAVALVTVLPEAVATVRIQGAPSGALKPGEVAELTVVALGASGATLLGRKTVWSSSDDAVATVQGGRVTARGAGTATIVATVEGKTASSSLTVSAPAPAADPAADDARAAQETTRLIDQFVEAMAKRDIAKLKEVYPSMPAEMERRWRALLEDSRLNRMQASRDPIPPPRRIGGDAVEVPFTLRLKPSYSGMASPQPPPLRYLATFQVVGGKWQLQQLEEKK